MMNENAVENNDSLTPAQMPLTLQEIAKLTENRKRHIRCLDHCRTNVTMLTQMVTNGVTSPEQNELVKTLAALALWELREQDKLTEMYL